MLDIPKALAAAKGLDDRLQELITEHRKTNALLGIQLSIMDANASDKLGSRLQPDERTFVTKCLQDGMPD
jgi:hypothetical protein